MPDLLNIKLNPTGYASAIGAVYAAVVMIYNAYNHHGVISTPVIIAAVAAIIALMTRTVVTPIAKPVDGAGRALVPAPEPGELTPLLPVMVGEATLGTTSGPVTATPSSAA